MVLEQQEENKNEEEEDEEDRRYSHPVRGRTTGPDDLGWL